MIPTVGRIVHYTDHVMGEPLQRAAIITKVVVDPGNSGDVYLTVLYPGLGLGECGCRTTRAFFSKTPEIGYWSWPERVSVEA